MAANAGLNALLDQLVALFNRRSLDLPDGLIDRRSQFRLNGTPFEAMLGRPPSDPLVLMLARGPAGYRFAVKALQHAVPDGRITRVPDDAQAGAGPRDLHLHLSGHLRGSGDAIAAPMHATLEVGPSGCVTMADLIVDVAILARLREARLVQD
ncbi:MAG: hypothetical protein R2712_28175 [Vicinamibacterales bacterium]